MSRGGFRGGRGGGGPQSGAMQLVSFDLLKDLGSGSLFNVQTALFPVSTDNLNRSCLADNVSPHLLARGCTHATQTHRDRVA